MDNWANDGCVFVYKYLGHDPNEPPAVVAGRTYEVDSRSLSDPTDIDSALETLSDGSIVNSVFLGYSSGITLDIPFGDTDHMLRIQFNNSLVQWDASEYNVASGIIGGIVPIHTMLNAMRVLEDVQDYISVLPGVFESQADIDEFPAGTEIPGTSCTEENVSTYNVDGEGCGSARYTCSDSGRCVEPEDHYDGVSLALTFSAVPAVLGDINTE